MGFAESGNLISIEHRIAAQEQAANLNMLSPVYLEIIVSLHCVFDDYGDISKWLTLPNPHLGELEPIVLITMGKGEKVLQFIDVCLDHEDMNLLKGYPKGK